MDIMNRKDTQTGRLVFIPASGCDLTAEQFLSYMNEGFCPVIVDTTSGVSFAFGSYTVSAEAVVIKNGNTTLYTLPISAA